MCVCGSGGLSGRVVGYQIGGPRFESQSGPSQFFIVHICVYPALNGKLDLLRYGESKGGEKSNGKLPHNAACQEQSGLYYTPGSQMLGLSVGLT
ncbi:hypothetical protein PoB_002037900 [Plakobranchus ocellatus]|uniref:Uncharacterized protein n=1 Tax=Plakobranchus ocellatus TaxID=259542 RepID=A0AAV3ZHK5_9GAST|nr:hypothetical protein PoB_002037900 [Plakobranchus ocellatus]